MRKIFLSILMLFSIGALFTSCIKQYDKAIAADTNQIEFDATVWNTPLSGQIYPVLVRVPTYGAAVSSANPSITRASGAIKFRVNFIGAQQSTAQTITYKLVSAPVLPAGVSAAVLGTHFSTSGTCVIPANSSFGEITITVINPGVSSTTPVGLVLELVGNDLIKPSANYRFLGVQVSQL